MKTISFIGRLTKDATANTLESGKSVINFTVAMNFPYKDKEGNKQQKVTYYECAYWKQESKIQPYLTKGMQVSIDAWLYADAYINKEGEAIGVIRATVTGIQLLGNNTPVTETKKKGKDKKETKSVASEKKQATAEDDLPF
jgi:single-strand DNA-binding protein